MAEPQEPKPQPGVGGEQVSKAGQPASQSDRTSRSKDTSEPFAASDKDPSTTATAPPAGDKKKDGDDVAKNGDDPTAAEDKENGVDGSEGEKKKSEEGEDDQEEAAAVDDKPKEKIHLDIVDELDRRIEEKPERTGVSRILLDKMKRARMAMTRRMTMARMVMQPRKQRRIGARTVQMVKTHHTKKVSSRWPSTLCTTASRNDKRV